MSGPEGAVGRALGSSSTLMRSAAAAITLTCLVGACTAAAHAPDAAEGGATASEAPPPTLGGAGLDPLKPSDASTSTRVAVLFASTCAGGPESSCHGSHAGDLWLRLRGPGADVVGVPSSEEPRLTRVAPHDAGASYLYAKLLSEGGIDGGRMPLGGPYDPRIKALVRAWIDEGAPVE